MARGNPPLGRRLDFRASHRAVALPVRTDLYTYAQAITRFSRAVGAARLGRLEMAQAEIEQLGALGQAAESSYWSAQIEIFKLAASAGVARAQSRDDDAVRLMRDAMEREHASEKNVDAPEQERRLGGRGAAWSAINEKRPRLRYRRPAE